MKGLVFANQQNREQRTTGFTSSAKTHLTDLPKQLLINGKQEKEITIVLSLIQWATVQTRQTCCRKEIYCDVLHFCL